ncbi:hypothetical protein [Caulobacter sp. SSI4214]|uniref:hypothetical protein n=1 Tax=Caulobacter sp. SSI4214 TaxID=2575739 RepID=UPI00143AC1C4|nr:hypothetical protein [Caulobacter sp. SSI4214]
MKSTVSSVDQPTREDVLAKLEDLVAGRTDRELASSWAGNWLAEDRIPGHQVHVTDLAAWNALTAIAGADTFGGDRKYLYDEEDFAAWANALNAAPR